jgi:hypothetical protein
VLAFEDLLGTYYRGQGHLAGTVCSGFDTPNERLVLQPGGSFFFRTRWYADGGAEDLPENLLLMRDSPIEDQGAARLQNGHFLLDAEQPNGGAGAARVPRDFFPVRWGTRTYLVPPEEMLVFCDGVNRGEGEPRQTPRGRFYLREGDHEKPAQGLPRMPTRWDQYVLATPVCGKITGAAGEGRWRVNLGAQDGLRPGLELYAARQPLAVQEVCVVSVEEGQCVVQICDRAPPYAAGLREGDHGFACKEVAEPHCLYCWILKRIGRDTAKAWRRPRPSTNGSPAGPWACRCRLDSSGMQ